MVAPERCFVIHTRLQATFEVNFASGRPSHIYLTIAGQWCDCLHHAIKSGCSFDGIDVSGDDKDEHEPEQPQDGISSDGDSQLDEVHQPLKDGPRLQTPTRGTQSLQDAPCLQTPTRGTQRHQPLQDLQTPTRETQFCQPLQDAPCLQTPTGGTQHCQPLQDVDILSSHQDMVLNDSHSAYLYAPYTPVAVRKAKRKCKHHV